MKRVLAPIPYLVDSLKALVYPPICLHCRLPVIKSQHTFCDACFELLQPVSFEGRCPYCFANSEGVCPKCREQRPIFHRMAAVFDYVGPAVTLIRKLKYGNQPYLAKGAGAFLAAQFLHLDWPRPDVIVPVPLSRAHWLIRGYNQSALLSESLSEIIQVPVHPVLRRKSGDYSQAGLTHEQRKDFNKSSITLRNDHQLYDRCVLLIDDVMTTGSTMRHCAEALLEGYPSAIYGLTVCRAIS